MLANFYCFVSYPEMILYGTIPHMLLFFIEKENSVELKIEAFRLLCPQPLQLNRLCAEYQSILSNLVYNFIYFCSNTAFICHVNILSVK